MRMGESPETVHVTGCPSIDLAAEASRRSPAPISIRGEVRRCRCTCRLVWAVTSSCLQHPVTTEHRAGAGTHIETLHAVRGREPAGALVLAQRRRGIGWHVATAIRIFRERADRSTSISSRTCIRRTSCGSCTTRDASSATRASAIRECSFLGVPAVNIGTRQHGPRARRQRHRRRLRPRCDRVGGAAHDPAATTGAGCDVRRRPGRLADCGSPEPLAARGRKAPCLLKANATRRSSSTPDRRTPWPSSKRSFLRRRASFWSRG